MKNNNNREKENTKTVSLPEAVSFRSYREKSGTIIRSKSFLAAEEVGTNLLGLKL